MAPEPSTSVNTYLKSEMSLSLTSPECSLVAQRAWGHASISAKTLAVPTTPNTSIKAVSLELAAVVASNPPKGGWLLNRLFKCASNILTTWAKRQDLVYPEPKPHRKSGLLLPTLKDRRYQLHIPHLCHACVDR
uniref:Uncharacterized protein n=2 Tax=Vibrio parahaemolyticus TaxID=670 RepID=A0A1L7NY83_VIBPH|nr:hypothetical protein [Vibrio parahaemolyticus]